MAGYTKQNLKEVEDQAPKFGMSPDLEFRMARVPLELENSGVSLFTLAPNFRFPFGHRHGEQEEVYVVVTGGARMKVEDDVVDLGPLDAIRIPGPVARGLEAGPEGAEVLAFGAPNTENKDAEMQPGWWPASS